ncbi:MAG: STAS domain-containing protein [Melioribacteraceae bacterium]|nr:STAS domain-containing protein [Melioribacteraceae bacterium]
MIFEKEMRDGITVITVHLKKATFANADSFREFLIAAIDDEHDKFIVDFTESHYIDSTFLGTLVVCFKKLDCVGADLKLVCNERIEFIICEITKLSHVLKVYKSLKDAIDSFAVPHD